MRVIIDISHPAHVHFFKNFVWAMEKRGHEIIITAGDKEVTLKLLENYGLKYRFTCKRTTGYKLILEVVKRDLQMLKFVREYKPDIVMGIASTIAAHVSSVTNVKSIVFTDTEHTKLADMITYPFSDSIVTPSSYNKDLGKKQIRYDGYHELAYLHPNYFKPNPEVLSEIGLQEGDPFTVLRFVSWGACHDIGHHGIENKIEFVKELEKYGRVLITSESDLGPEFEKYKIKVSPEKLHDLLHYATLHVGDGGTTAVESAVLGTPSIYISSLAGTMGNFIELEEKYGLMLSYKDSKDALEKAIELAKNPNTNDEWNEKRNQLLKDKIDVTSFMVEFVSKYC
ncbi:MAG: DUF354 domain-containing protein [Methanococcoides sp.]|nr:DUF354 domain-containing protein [Methanococcoides sp.]